MAKDIMIRIRRLPKRYSITFVAGTLIVVIGAAIAMYVYYQTSPQKIVYDAVQNALTSSTLMFEGTVMRTASDNSDAVAAVDGQLSQTKSRLAIAGTSTDQLKGEMITDRDDTFLKINRASELVASAVPSHQTELYASILPQIKQTIDGKWIWIEQSDVALVGSIVKLSGCSVDIVQSITKSTASRTALLNVYKNHPFFVVSEDGAGTEQIGNYTLKINNVIFDEFMASFPSSSLATKLSGCQYQSPAITSETLRGFTIHLTIDKKNRQIVEVDAHTGQTSQLRVFIKPDFSTPSVINNPQDITRFSDIKQQVFKGFLSNSSGVTND